MQAFTPAGQQLAGQLSPLQFIKVPTIPGWAWYSDKVAVTVYVYNVLLSPYSNLEGLSDMWYPHFSSK